MFYLSSIKSKYDFFIMTHSFRNPIKILSEGLVFINCSLHNYFYDQLLKLTVELTELLL